MSQDPKKRLTLHNKGHGAKLARDHNGFELVYISAPFVSKSEARIREIQIKGWSRNKKEYLISGKWQ